MVEPGVLFETCQRALEIWDKSATVRLGSYNRTGEGWKWHREAARRLATAGHTQRSTTIGAARGEEAKAFETSWNSLTNMGQDQAPARPAPLHMEYTAQRNGIHLVLH